MKYVFVILVLLCSIHFAWADRALYTSELVEGSTVIGIWTSNEIEPDGTLRYSHDIFRGKYTEIKKARQYSARLTKAIQRIKKEGPFILFVRVNGKKADLVGDSGRLRYSAIALKAVKSVIRQLDLKAKWKKLSVDEQIERSDLIVSGKIGDDGPECPKDYAISLGKTYRGVPPKKISILPVPAEQVGIESIFFIQRHNGVGPEYIVMNAVPLKEAKEYLKRLKETKVSQQTDSPG